VRLAVLEGLPDELLVLDEAEPCPYLPGRVARMPLRLPVRSLTPSETDARFAAGDRRHGRLLYRPSCPACQACQPIRVDVARFVPSRSQRRTLARGDRELVTRIGPPEVSAERLALYERHKRGRGLSGDIKKPLDEKGYVGFLVDRCVDAFELRYEHHGKLVGLAVTDRGQESLSAVYCFFDPALARLGIGTYSILKQIELCRAERLAHLYLGLYIEDNPHMRYKARFRPHERLVGGAWMTFA
jgi:arginine-tRNA-protein transferase